MQIIILFGCSFSVLRPGSQFRREALVGATCEMLWRAGEETKCCVAFTQEGDPAFTQTSEYRYDGITEKVNIARGLASIYTQPRSGCVPPDFTILLL